MKTETNYNVQIWVGCKADYDGIIYPTEYVKRICRDFVDTNKLCVSVTKTDFIYTGGEEPGVVVGLINYPRFPRTKKEILRLATELAGILMEFLEQNRVTITTQDKNIMLERDEGAV